MTSTRDRVVRSNTLQSLLFSLISLSSCTVAVDRADGAPSEHIVAPDTNPPVEALLTAEQFASLPVLTLKLGEPICASGESAPACELGSSGELISEGTTHLVRYDLDAGALARITGRPGAVQWLGRNGAGPGEYRMIWAAGVDRSGGVAAFDPVQRKFLRFGAEGVASESSGFVLPAGFITAGFIGTDLWAVAGDIEGDHATGDSVNIFLYQFGRNGEFRRAAVLPLRQPGRGLEDMRPPPAIFAPREMWHFARDGRVLHSDGEALVVDVYDSTGRHTLRLGAAVSPRDVTDAEFAREFEERTSRAPSGPMGRAIREQAAVRVSHHAAITAMRQIENGQIWIREAPTENGDSVGWVVFSHDGGAVGRLRLPGDLRILAATKSDFAVLPGGTGVMRWAKLEGIP